jgi:hypothetical protein
MTNLREGVLPVVTDASALSKAWRSSTTVASYDRTVMKRR